MPVSSWERNLAFGDFVKSCDKWAANKLASETEFRDNDSKLCKLSQNVGMDEIL